MPERLAIRKRLAIDLGNSERPPPPPKRAHGVHGALRRRGKHAAEVFASGASTVGKAAALFQTRLHNLIEAAVQLEEVRLPGHKSSIAIQVLSTLPVPQHDGRPKKPTAAVVALPERAIFYRSADGGRAIRAVIARNSGKELAGVTAVTDLQGPVEGRGLIASYYFTRSRNAGQRTMEQVVATIPRPPTAPP